MAGVTVGCDGRATNFDANTARPSFHFVDVADQVGIQTPLYSGGAGKRFIVEAKGGSAGAFFDHDGDGDLDLYVVNGSQLDRPAGTAPRSNILYRNDLSPGVPTGTPIGTPTGTSTATQLGASPATPTAMQRAFTDISEAAGVGDTGWGMGVTTADYDNDGDQDIYVTNFGANAFYRSKADGTYEEIAMAAGVADSGWSTGCA
ncbi:MAG: VCBS repeat-containing protein, partial [Verrucomicrobia bacterium]|nr:VCBS repeat-containing protein [Verrucomicrobiota bacterium]